MNWTILGLLCCCPAACCGDARKRVSKTHGRMLIWLKNEKHGKPWVTNHILKTARADPETGCVEGCHYALMQFDLINSVPEDVCELCFVSLCCGNEPSKSGQYYGHGFAAPCQVCLLDNKEQVQMEHRDPPPYVGA